MSKKSRTDFSSSSSLLEKSKREKKKWFCDHHNKWTCRPYFQSTLGTVPLHFISYPTEDECKTSCHLAGELPLSVLDFTLKKFGGLKGLWSMSHTNNELRRKVESLVPGISKMPIEVVNYFTNPILVRGEGTDEEKWEEEERQDNIIREYLTSMLPNTRMALYLSSIIDERYGTAKEMIQLQNVDDDLWDEILKLKAKGYHDPFYNLLIYSEDEDLDDRRIRLFGLFEQADKDTKKILALFQSLFQVRTRLWTMLDYFDASNKNTASRLTKFFVENIVLETYDKYLRDVDHLPIIRSDPDVKNQWILDLDDYKSQIQYFAKWSYNDEITEKLIEVWINYFKVYLYLSLHHHEEWSFQVGDLKWEIDPFLYVDVPEEGEEGKESEEVAIKKLHYFETLDKWVNAMYDTIAEVLEEHGKKYNEKEMSYM